MISVGREFGSIIHLDVIVTTLDGIALPDASSFAVTKRQPLAWRRYNGFEMRLLSEFLKEQGQEEAI